MEFLNKINLKDPKYMFGLLLVGLLVGYLIYYLYTKYFSDDNDTVPDFPLLNVPRDTRTYIEGKIELILESVVRDGARIYDNRLTEEDESRVVENIKRLILRAGLDRMEEDYIKTDELDYILTDERSVEVYGAALIAQIEAHRTIREGSLAVVKAIKARREVGEATRVSLKEAAKKNYSAMATEVVLAKSFDPHLQAPIGSLEYVARKIRKKYLSEHPRLVVADAAQAVADQVSLLELDPRPIHEIVGAVVEAVIVPLIEASRTLTEESLAAAEELQEGPLGEPTKAALKEAVKEMYLLLASLAEFRKEHLKFF